MTDRIDRQRIQFFGRPMDVGCDRRCTKAWGISRRPQRQLGDHPDDYVFLADSELGEAPVDPGTYEGGYGKPPAGWAGPLNRWCVRECERSFMVDAGEPAKLPDLEHPRPNMPHRWSQ